MDIITEDGRVHAKLEGTKVDSLFVNRPFSPTPRQPFWLPKKKHCYSLLKGNSDLVFGLK